MFKRLVVGPDASPCHRPECFFATSSRPRRRFVRKTNAGSCDRANIPALLGVCRKHFTKNDRLRINGQSGYRGRYAFENTSVPPENESDNDTASAFVLRPKQKPFVAKPNSLFCFLHLERDERNKSKANVNRRRLGVAYHTVRKKNTRTIIKNKKNSENPKVYKGPPNARRVWRIRTQTNIARVVIGNVTRESFIVTKLRHRLLIDGNCARESVADRTASLSRNSPCRQRTRAEDKASKQTRQIK